MINKIIKIVAFIELSIGEATIFGTTVSTLLLLAKKSPNVFIFVILSATASAVIGIGLYHYKEWARMLLVFFSGYIIVTKMLVFANLLHFNGEIITFISTGLKNYISIAYHAFVMLFFTRQATKKCFPQNTPGV